VTGNRTGTEGTQVRAAASPTRSVEQHREALENLRRLEIQLQTASVLERRADLSTNPTLAAVLRERAQERRRIADVVRAHLAAADADPGRGDLTGGPGAAARSRARP
jgi:hypothetical protein